MVKEKIAIVGFASRLPGSAPANLWSCLVQGSDLVAKVPEVRWSADFYGHTSKSAAGACYAQAAGTIGDISGFDATFFGMSPREAEQLDPQQRLLLEMSWEAFESAGIAPSSVRRGKGGVFIGFSGSDWSYRRSDDLASLDATSMTGQTGSVAANRISYNFDLTGPSVAVDTACSSSLVAFHQACQSILLGESDFALTGGISLHLHPYAFVGFSRASMLSPRGICNVFDAAGDGYVRSEGGGIFLLKSLERAIADGDRVYGVVAGTGVNCDGRTNGITVPGVDTQAALLKEVYERAGVSPADIDYLEAHGTGTAVGDPIECHSLGTALGQLRSPDSPLLIGSVKSNMGHLETASGVAGLVKALLCLKHRSVPPTIHLKTPNPNIKFDEWNLKVVTENTPLDPDKRLTVGVNSFGFGGANAHVVLQSADHPAAAGKRPAKRRSAAVPLVVSGRSEAAAKASAARLADHVAEQSDASHYDIAYSAAFHRDWHACRAIAYADQSAQQLADLTAYAAGETTDQLVSGVALEAASQPVFVYSGNGSQWAGMGRELLEQSRLFAKTVGKVDRIFRRYADFSIVDELRREDLDERLALTEIAQPLLFAVQVGITEMLRKLGAEPGAVVGHSVGEAAAAWACGALTLEQAVQVIHERSLQQATTRGAGAMTAVGLGHADCIALLGSLDLQDKIAIAGINSARGVTVAGAASDLQALEAVLAEREVFHRRLPLDYAFHSPAMDPIEAPLRHDLAGLKPGKGRLPFYSTVTGGLLAGNGLDAGYWWLNIREPVQFQRAIDELVGDGYNIFVEIGPHAVLRTYVNDGLRAAGKDGRVIPTMRRDHGGKERIVAAFYQMLVDGAPIDPHKIYPHPGRFVDLPTYPWQRERYWHPVTSEGYNLINRYKEHPLLGYRLCENDTQWENHLDTQLYPYLADHAVGDAVVFPAAGFVEMALAAAQLWHGDQPRQAAPRGDLPVFTSQELEELEILAPLLLEDQPSKTVRFAIDEADGRFTIRSRQRLSQDPWQLHAVGRLPGKPEGGAPHGQLAAPQAPATVDATGHYGLTARVGLNYGPAFQAVSGVWAEDDAVVARLDLPRVIADQMDAYHLHPSLLDGCFQLLVDILREEIAGRGGVAFVPVKVGRLRIHQRGAGVHHARAALLRRSPRAVVAGFRLYDAAGALIAELEEVRFRGVLLRRTLGDQTGYLRFQAVPKPLDQARPAVLPANGSLPDAGKRSLHAPERVTARGVYYREVEPLLDVLCAAFAYRALRQLCPGESTVRVDTLLASGTVRPEFGAYLQRLVSMLLEDGMLEPTAGGLAWSGEMDLPEPDAIWTSLLGDYPDYAAEILMLGRVGEHLVEVLRGDQPVDALLPMDAGHPMLAHYLSGSPSLQAGNRAIVDMVNVAQQTLPEGHRLRIMEFTGGRSQLSTQLLPLLDLDHCDYRVLATDAQALEHVESLRERFPALESSVLDLNQPLPPSRFDVILLSHELAVASDPDRLLAVLSSQLAPEGVLMLAEQPSTRWSEMVFGLSPSWWREAADGQLPRQHPAAVWAKALERHGLVDCAVIHDLPQGNEGPYLMIARASGAAELVPASPPAADGHWLVLQDAAGEGTVLADLVVARLRAAGRRPCTAVVPAKDATALQTILTEAQADRGGLDGILLLHGLPLDGADEQAAGDRCVMAAELAKACAAVAITPQLVLVTTGATGDLVSDLPAAPLDDAALWGFGRTLMNEYPDLRIRLVEVVDPHDPEGAAGAIAAELLAPDAEDEVIYAGGGRYAPRLRVVAPADLSDATSDDADRPAAPARLDFSAPGPLKNLLWRPQELPPVTGDNVEIAVRAAGLNFRDVMYAMGLLSDEALEAGFAGPTLGMELSGIITAVGPEVKELSVGDEVVAFAPASFAERAVTPAAAVARKPADWSFNAAATVPTTFFTAYYALHHLAQLEEGERLLIHGAAGGVGLAAIQLGKAMGAEIFATAGSDAKRDVVRLLGADHVLDSRSLAFADDVLALTDGQGVDVVLNSLAGEAINRNLRILRPFGRFMELGKRDFYENTRIGLRPFRNNISYFGIDADQLMAERPALTRRLFGELMALFDDGALKPLPYRAFPATQAVDAFRYMQQSRQIGKVVLNFDAGVGHVQRPPPKPQRLVLDADGTYLVTGGMRGFGLATARWLADKGARNLVLLSRRGAADDEGAQVIEALQKSGVRVRAFACDVTDKAALATVLDAIAADTPPLRGVVHAAMVIDDGLVRSLDGERIRNVLAPKIDGARHLCELTRDLPLDFLVFYSSATTLFGNPGQASYVAANRYLEALAHARRAAGLPALSVSWGAIDDVGYLARNSEIKEQLQSRMGGAALTSSEALDALEQLLVRDLSGLGVMELEWGALRRFLPTSLSPKFQDLAQQAEEAGADAEGLEQLQRWLEEMNDEQLAEALGEVLKKEIGEILHVSPERIADDRSLYDLGMDSLMGMEMVAAVEARFGVSLPVMALSEGPTVTRLVERIVRQLRVPDAGGDDDAAQTVARVAAQHASETDTHTLTELANALSQGDGASGSLTDDR